MIEDLGYIVGLLAAAFVSVVLYEHHKDRESERRNRDGMADLHRKAVRFRQQQAADMWAAYGPEARGTSSARVDAAAA